MQKRSLTLSGHRTSVALEPEFWSALEAIARDRRISLPALLGEIDRGRGERSLASALRVTALNEPRWLREIDMAEPRHALARETSGADDQDGTRTLAESAAIALTTGHGSTKAK